MLNARKLANNIVASEDKYTDTNMCPPLAGDFGVNWNERCLLFVQQLGMLCLHLGVEL